MGIKRLTPLYLLRLFKHEKAELIQNGVYSISFNGSDKKYIGAATKKHSKWNECGFYIRWRQHLSMLISDKHYNKKLQSSFNKYGINNIKFNIEVSMTSSKEDIFKKEESMIIEHDAVKNGYNIDKKEEHKKYIQKGLFCKSVYVFYLNGCLFKVFKSQKECAVYFDIDAKKMSAFILKNKIYKEFAFFSSNLFCQKTIKKAKVEKEKRFIIYDERKNEIYEHDNVRNSIINFNLDVEVRNVYGCLNNHIPSTNGYLFVYLENVATIRIPHKNYLCLYEDNKISKIYNSLKELANDIGKSKTSIENYLNGIGRKGFINSDIRKTLLPIPIYRNFLLRYKNNIK